MPRGAERLAVYSPSGPRSEYCGNPDATCTGLCAPRGVRHINFRPIQVNGRVNTTRLGEVQPNFDIFSMLGAWVEEEHKCFTMLGI
jgi:hypothetical protein